MVFGKKKKEERVDVEAETITKETKDTTKEPEIQIVVFDELILSELRAIRATLERIEEQGKE